MMSTSAALLLVLLSCPSGVLVQLSFAATFRAEIAPLAGATVPNVTGVAIAFEDGTAIGYGGFLTGLEPGLEAATCNATNGCGVHVHEGTSCETTESQGNHYYTTDVDPWVDARYSSDEDGNASFSGVVIAGETDLEGRAFVVHAENGTRIACGVLERVDTSETLAAETVPLTDAGAAGPVEIYPLENGRICFMGSAVQLEPDLVSFLVDETSTNCTAKNGCGAHVHEGKDCTNVDTQLGHFYNADELEEDPWALVGYLTTDSAGDAYFVDCLTTLEDDYDGRAFIVHANDGSRVACGLLERGAGALPSISLSFLVPIVGMLTTLVF